MGGGGGREVLFELNLHFKTNNALGLPSHCV